jgi:hypothetical protein
MSGLIIYQTTGDEAEGYAGSALWGTEHQLAQCRQRTGGEITGIGGNKNKLTRTESDINSGGIENELAGGDCRDFLGIGRRLGLW